MKSRGSLFAFMIILGLSLCAGLVMIAPYLQALFVGGILSLVMLPFYQLLRNRKIGRHLAAAVTTVAMVLLVVGPFLSFAAIAIKQATGIGQWLVRIEHDSLQDYLSQMSSWGPVRYFSIDPTELGNHLKEILQYTGTVSTKFLLTLAGSVPEGILQLILACFACYCLLTDGRKFSEWVFGRIPMDPDIRKRITSTFKDTAISVVLASMAAAGAQSLVMMLGFLILRVPGAFLAGGATFILAFIPLFGSTPVWIVGSGYLYFQGSVPSAFVMLGFGIAAGTIDNFVRPVILKGRGEMHPLVSLVAIFGGLQWLGLFGVFLGPILAAIIITLLQLWPLVGRPYGLVFARDPLKEPDYPLATEYK